MLSSERLGSFELPGPMDLLFDSVKFKFEFLFALANLDAFAADGDWNPLVLLFKLQSKADIRKRRVDLRSVCVGGAPVRTSERVERSGATLSTCSVGRRRACLGLACP